jgi:hypothetical protein
VPSIYDGYPTQEPELSYFVIDNAPYKYYKILMSSLAIRIGQEAWNIEFRDLWERIVQNILWFGPFTNEMIEKKIFQLVGKGWHVDPFKNGNDIFLREIPYVKWMRVYCNWYWLLRWYN